MTRAKDISKIVTDANLSGTLDVTGAVTAGGLTLAPSQVINLNSGADSFDDIFRNESENATIINARNNVRINLDSNSDSTNAEFVIGYNGTNTTTAKALSVGESGDISFYEDTGTTPKLFWDASAEILGIGTSSPADVRLTLFSGGSGTAGQLKLGFDSNDFFQIGRNDIAGAGGGNFQIKPNGGTSIFDITSGGNVGIGTSSPDEKLDVRGSLQVGVDGTTAGLIRLMDSGSVTEEATISTDANGGLIFGGNSGAGELIFRTGSSTERMRIDSSGQVQVPGNTHSVVGIDESLNVNCFRDGSGNDYGIFVSGNNSSGSHTSMRFYNNINGLIGSITHGATSTAYNTSSDHRIKLNVDYTFDATTRLKQLKPCRFNFIADADTTVDGFLAHEVQSVVPEAITGTHNEVDADGNPVYQGIDQSKLVPLLVKTIQELEARITALETQPQ